MDKDERLSRLDLLITAREEAEIHVSEAVISARLGGASWQEIGTVLGMTRQGAQKRYAGMLPYQFALPADT